MKESTILMRKSDNTFVPVAGLTLFAIASGYLMSLIPLSMGSFDIDTQYAGWLASAYYIGLLIGSMMIEPVIAKIGHRLSFIGFLVMLAVTVILLPWTPTIEAWLPNRLIAGIAVAGIFVVVESWLLIGDNPKERAKRLSFYMTSLYGGTTLGQLAIGVIGTQGVVPFIVVLGLLLVAILPPLLVRQGQPACGLHQKLSLKQITRLSKPAIMGCMVSGIVMGTIYGLMPLSLKNDHYTTDQVGVLMASIILGGMLIQPVISKLSVMMSKTLLLAMVSLLGVFAMGMIYISTDYVVMIVALALLGMSSFALYPIAITLACDNLDSSFIVAATQVMLFSYSVGSAMGPIAAGTLLEQHSGLTNFFFIVLLVTAIYMLTASLRRKASVLAN
ncbi:putative MFS-type transporter YcaD [Providencia alcalifaciens]|nr:putative MFS-type transporter YcaD [Providencia alcalifaciens]CAG9423125.1 putative MFS-type transporter YcaD [Providencia alcalifaciens]CAG9427150.1 putative MFS-type transporter YcaD [Providencia alcalifaciens]CAG9427412.1 putative MFS-type transporter YcaD [Providencia alcalifaciens]CAG9428182.1 putative MFS-type transporter YcaD [Providencia alcalifaciens]